MQPVSLFCVAVAANLVALNATYPQTTTSSQKQHVERIVFGGGPLGKYVDSVRRQFKNANIAIEGPIRDSLILPEVDFKAVSLPTALQWIGLTNVAKARVVDVRFIPSSRDTSAVWLITAPKDPKPIVESGMTTTRLPAYVGTDNSLRPEMVLRAIDQAFKDRAADKPKISYDSSTHWITVSGGTPMGRTVATQIIETSKRDARDDQLSTLQTQLRNLRTENDSLRRRIAAATKGS